MGKTVISAPKAELYTTVSDFLESNPFNATGWLYKIGPLCFIYLSASWSSYSGNNTYNMGKLKEAYRPVQMTALPSFINRNSTGLNSPTFVTINTNGNIIMTTSAWNTDGSGRPCVWACYFCEK